MLWGNVFMRGEWEYIKFCRSMNTSVTMNSVRAGNRLQVLILRAVSRSP